MLLQKHMVTIQSIINKAKVYLPALNEGRVMRAYQFAEEAHHGQARFSGEPYIIHPLSVTDILLDFHPDENSIMAALLHDVAEDTSRTLGDIEAVFGKEIRDLCDGLMKLSKVRQRLNDSQVENLRKLFLAMAKDFRVVLIKLCDRLHNMSTMEFVRPEKRVRIAQETINIYAPIAARLGIYRLKSQLEDLCFEHLYPTEFADLKGQLTKTDKWREKYIGESKKILQSMLAKEGIAGEVDGRVKSIYSIFRKMQKKNKTSIDEIFDVFAMRIVLPDINKQDKEYTGHIYTALGILHSHFTPLANRFKDYVAVPKVNGYRSLHTTVMGLGSKAYTQPTEVQIRTYAMHQASEFGIAAHWIYEETGVVPVPKSAYDSDDSSDFERHKEWISGLGQIEQEFKNNQELLEHLKVDAFQDRIFVLTPRGDVKDLPAGATPVDFAFAVHSDIGNHFVGVKVNGSMVSADFELKSGDVVEVITRKNAQPSHRWLTFVKTTQARNRIRSWFRDMDDDKRLRIGKELLNEKLAQLGKAPLDVGLSLLKHYNGENLSVNDREQLLMDIGKGFVLVGTVLRKLFTLEELLVGRPPKGVKKASVRDVSGGAKEKPRLVIGNEKSVPYQFVKCCDATFSDSLVGYITRGRGVSVHKKNCPVLHGGRGDRLVSVMVEGAIPKYDVTILVEADDRLGLMRDMAQTFADTHVNIIQVTQEVPRTGKVGTNFLAEVESFDQLETVLSNLEKIPSVRRACKVN